jgi:hypothetical protein
MHTRLSLHGTRHLRRASVLGVAIGACLAVASPLAAPRQDHALLMELANRELTRCQDELAKLRRIGGSDDQSVDQTIKTMAAQLAASAEADCRKLKAAVDAAAETDAERRSTDASAQPASPGLPLAQPRQDAPAAAGTNTATPPPAPPPQSSQPTVPPAEHPAAVPPAAAAQPPGATLSIHFPASSEPATAEAKALAAQFGSSFERTENHAEADTPPKALVLYTDQSDHAAAKGIANALADQHYAWRLDKRAPAQSGAASRTVEVWIPSAKRNPAKDAAASAPAGRHAPMKQ